MWRLPLVSLDFAMGRARRRAQISGSIPAMRRVAVVGSRAMRRDLVCDLGVVLDGLSARGCALVSGGAIGVDEHAHRGALARCIPQLVVLPLGPDRPYPERLCGLFEAVALAPKSGVIFVRDAGAAPNKGAFVSRNRCVIALSDALLVLQAERRSGSLQTGMLALRAGIPVAAREGSSGCDSLIEAGATYLGNKAIEVSMRDWLDGTTKPSRAGTRPATLWPPSLLALRDRLAEHGCRGVARAELTMIEMSQLTRAQLLGLIDELEGGRIRPRN